MRIPSITTMNYSQKKYKQVLNILNISISLESKNKK